MKTALITGANRGIGLALAQQLSQRGWDIIAVCRTSSDEIEQIANAVISNTKMGEVKSPAKACAIGIKAKEPK